MSADLITTIAIVLICYLGLLLFIGWRAAKRTHGGEDFHLAGRSLGAWAAAISSTASSESGWVTLGAVGMTYTHGISGLWYAPGCLLGYLVNLYWVAPRLCRLSRAQQSLTMTDILAKRWGDPHHLIRIISVAIVLLAMIGYVAAQMTAAGKAFSSSLGLDQSLGDFSFFGRGIATGYLIGVLIGAAVITFITSLGGFRGVAWTDLFQGLLMAFGLVALPLFAVVQFGGFTALTQALEKVDPALVSVAGDRTSAAAIGFIVGELGIGLGYPGMPHVITRYMAARGDAEIRRLRLIAILWGVAVFYGAGFAGLVARVTYPDLADGERALIVIAVNLLHPALAGLMLAAVISAILSTVSSQLLVAASSVSYDIVEGVLGRRPDDRRSLALGRITVAAVGFVGMISALNEIRLVFWFVLFAWSILGSSFGPLVLLALKPTGTTRYGALAGMLTGLGVSIAWKLGRGMADDPSAFSLVPWVTVAVWLLAQLLGTASRKFERGDTIALATACSVTLLAWFLVQQWQLNILYELVPGFAFSALVTLAVSRLAPTPPPEAQ